MSDAWEAIFNSDKSNLVMTFCEDKDFAVI